MATLLVTNNSPVRIDDNFTFSTNMRPDGTLDVRIQNEYQPTDFGTLTYLAIEDNGNSNAAHILLGLNNYSSPNETSFIQQTRPQNLPGVPFTETYGFKATTPSVKNGLAPSEEGTFNFNVAPGTTQTNIANYFETGALRFGAHIQSVGYGTRDEWSETVLFDTPITIPEPSFAGLLLTGALAIAAAYRKK